MSPAAIVPVCDRLEAMDFLRRVRDTEDRRICWFELTDAGAGTLDLVSTTIAANIKPALETLSDRDQRTLAGILDTLTGVLTAGPRTDIGARSGVMDEEGHPA